MPDTPAKRTPAKPKRHIDVAQAIVATAAAIGLLYYLRTILIPLVIAFVLTVLVDALVRSLQKRWPRLKGWIVSFLAALTIIVGLARRHLRRRAGRRADRRARAEADPPARRAWSARRRRRSGMDEPVKLTTLLGQISVPQLAGQILAALQGLVSALFIVLVYFGFMLAERTRMPAKVRKMVGSSDRSMAILRGAQQIAADIQTYVWVQTLTGVMLAGFAGIVMAAVGLDNALFWTFVLFLLSFIPVLGVTVGSVAPALFALLQFDTVGPALIIFGGIQVAAAIVGNVIYPRMQAETQNIGAVATLLALAFWTFLWGLPGAFLAVPLTLMLMMVFATFDNTRWVAVLLSNDGNPNFPKMLPTGKTRRSTRAAGLSPDARLRRPVAGFGAPQARLRLGAQLPDLHPLSGAR